VTDNEIEIGTSTTLEIDKEYLVHIQAKPLEFAYFLKKLQDNLKDEQGEPLSQRDLAKYLRDIGYSIAQPDIHRHLSLFNLEPKYLQMFKEGNMGFITAYKMSRLSPDLRQVVFECALREWADNTKDIENEADKPPLKIYQRHVDTIKRKHLASDNIFQILMKQDDFEEPYETVTEEVEEETKLIAEEVISEHDVDSNIMETDELTNIVSMLKIRASDEKRIKPTDLQMYATQSKHVQKAIELISTYVKQALEKEGYKVH